tara:strand:- start:2259 stop:2963 length:705 start_codon:yes stop_codon:yes gene_type:complete
MTIHDLQKEYELKKGDFWEHPQSKSWIITHDAVEVIANKEGIKIVDIKVLNSETDLVRFLVSMSNPNGGIVISIGEADRNNCFSQYLGCMAEKRGIDRCVLKHINAYQYGIYSEVESDDFRKPDISNIDDTVEDELAEQSGKPVAIIQNTPETSEDGDNSLKYELVCPLCSGGIKDQREFGSDGVKHRHFESGKKMPTFKCYNNDDVNNPTCKFATWELDEVKAKVVAEEKLPF